MEINTIKVESANLMHEHDTKSIIKVQSYFGNFNKKFKKKKNKLKEHIYYCKIENPREVVTTFASSHVNIKHQLSHTLTGSMKGQLVSP